MLRTFVTSVRELRGQEIADAIIDRARPEIRDGLRLGSITTNGWYPVDWYVELHKIATELTREGPALSRAIGREGSRQNFKGVYRFFAMILSPDSIMKRADHLYKMFWDTGRLEVIEVRPGYSKIRFVGCEGFDANLWGQLIGASEMMGELGGGEDVTIKTLSGGGDSPDMLIEATWR